MNTDEDQTLVLIATVQIVHLHRRLLGSSAVGLPKRQQDDFAPQVAPGQWLAARVRPVYAVQRRRLFTLKTHARRAVI